MKTSTATIEPNEPHAARRKTLATPWQGNTQHAGDQWRIALETLVLQRRCPWCRNALSAPVVSADGLTWTCSGGCNP